MAMICLLAGAAMALANPPVGFWWLAWIALIPPWLLVEQRIKAQERGIPWAAMGWGLAYYGGTLFWITGLHPLTWMGIPWAASGAIALFSWLFITLWGTALVSLWVWTLTYGGMQICRLGRQTRASQTSASSPGCTKAPLTLGVILLGTGLWCGLETLWSWGPLYWGGLGLTQSPHNLAILHLGQLVGPNGVVAAIVGINGLLAQGLSQGFQRRGMVGYPNPSDSIASQIEMGPYPARTHPTGVAQLKWRVRFLRALGFSWAMPTLRNALCLALVLGLGLHGLGGILYRLPLDDDPAMALKLGIVQGNIATSVKLTGDGIRQSLDRYTRGYLELVDRNGDRNPPLRELRGQRGGAALTSQFLEESNGELDGELDGVLMPEGALPILWQGATRDASSLYGAIRERGVTAWIGTFLSQGDRYSQSLITITATGEMLSRYNKVKLVPLGEYIPLENTLGKLIGRLSPIESALTPGTPDQTFLTPWGLAAVAICYEPPFANLIRRQVAAGGQFILTASNLDPYGTVLMAQHEAQDVMRAIEGDRWLVRATNTGYSGFITPHGQVQWRSPAHQYVTHAETIYRRQGQTLYSRWGNWLVPVLLITAVLVLFL